MMLRPLALLLSAVALVACGFTVNELNPHPSVAVAGTPTPVSLDVSAVADAVELGVGAATLSIHQLRRTLDNAFRNAAGSKVAPAGTPSLKLTIDQMVWRRETGGFGGAVLIEYRARWTGPDGQLLAEVSGVAETRDPQAEGERRVAGAIEVMFEKMVAGLDETTHPTAPRGGGAVLR
jgi:hypothetical protein